MINRMGRREFLKVSGAAAGMAAASAFLPRFVFARQNGGEAAFAASAIQHPVFVAPAIVRQGAGIPFMNVRDGSLKLDSIWLSSAGAVAAKKIPLEQKHGADGELSLVPGEVLQPGMYDIFATVGKGGASRIERQPNAVKVVDKYKKDFTFAVISDVHIGDSRIQAKIPGFKAEEALKREISIMNEKQVEFCLCCGDLCFIPPKSKNELLAYADILGSQAKFPVFTVPGNHDGYCSGAGGKIQYDTMAQWSKYFGPMGCESGYGGITIIGINTYDKPALKRNIFGGLGDEMDIGAMSPGQLALVESELKHARDIDPSGTIIVIGHHNPTNTVVDVNGPFSIVPFSEVGRKELLALLEKYTPEYMFVGHVHGVHEETYAKTRIITVPTAGSLPAEGHPIGFYLVSVAGGKIGPVETVVIEKP